MAYNNATDTTKDGHRKQVHSENEIRSPSLMGSNKGHGKVGTEDRPMQSLKIEKGGEVLPSTKERKNHTKTSTQSVAIEVLFHPRRQKSLLFLLKGVNFEERSASIASVHLLYLIHRRHLLPRCLQRHEV